MGKKEREKAARAMERTTLGVSPRDKIRNEFTRQITNVLDLAQKISQLKWQ